MNFLLVAPNLQTNSNIDHYSLENPLGINSDAGQYTFLDEEADGITRISTNSKNIQKVSKPLKPISQLSTQKSRPNYQKCNWMPSEDAEVIELVSKCGQRWTQISASWAPEQPSKSEREIFINLDLISRLQLGPTKKIIYWSLYIRSLEENGLR